MARSDWDWRPRAHGAQDVANLHVCLALLRVYRSVQLPVDEMDLGAAMRPFWPLLRLFPRELKVAVQQFQPRVKGRRRRPGPFTDDSKHWGDAITAVRALPLEPVDVLDPIGEALLSDARSFRPLFDAIETTLEKLVATRPLAVEPKIVMLAQLLQLSAHELAYLRLCAAMQAASIGSGGFAHANAPTRLVQAIRVAIGAPDDHTVRSMLRRTSPLARSGLLQAESVDSIRDMEDMLRLSRQGMLIFSSPASTLTEVAELVLHRMPEPIDASLQWPHLAERTQLVRGILTNAVRAATPGINVLLYGAPGTGKTQYAERLVHESGASGFVVADRDADGDAASRGERLSSMMLTQVFAPERQSVVLLDEAEDIFQADYNNPIARAMGKREESKSWMNNLLEGNRHPVVWISNRIDHLDPAYLRRFTCCVEFPQTPRRVRAEIARRYLEPVGCSAQLIQEVAAAPTVSPALVASASRFAALASLHGGAADSGVRTMLTDMVAALGGDFRTRLPERATRYDTRYLNVRGSASPDRLLQALERTRRGRVLLSGPPGTGKTQLATEVALRLGRELVYRTASDINSMWFGESERNVARLFKDCDPATEVLFLDEAETLLTSREAAQNRPEQAVTAEFLRQVECFSGIFLCATNHEARLDPAMLRRFEFRLQFEPLDPGQRMALFAETAMGWQPLEGAELPEIDPVLRARLDRLDRLTPGDFANVVRRLQMLGMAAEPESVVEELESEQMAKPGARHRVIGFV